MIKSNKIFISFVKLNSEDISFNSYDFTLDNALDRAISHINTHYNYYKDNYKDINDYLIQEDCYIYIDVISCNRVKFKSKLELKNYFDLNINNISNNKLYDFLLSISDHDSRCYDYYRNLISSEQFLHCDNTDILAYEIKFTEDSCNKGKYTFRIID